VCVFTCEKILPTLKTLTNLNNPNNPSFPINPNNPSLLNKPINFSESGNVNNRNNAKLAAKLAIATMLS
jgi:hypothetical protein